MVSVFDIASEFVDRADGQIEAVKLQKLCFYAFGWYAHLTGEPLFSEEFYAMRYGPVVGHLLSAHAGRKEVDQKILDCQFQVWDTQREKVSAYIEKVIDSVWKMYGSKASFCLAEYSHGEKVWEDAWYGRPEESERAAISQDTLIDYFIRRTPRAGEIEEFPPPMLTLVDPEVMDRAEHDSAIHEPFIEAIRKQYLA